MLHVNLLSEANSVIKSVSGLPQYWHVQTHKQFLCSPHSISREPKSILLIELPFGKVLHDIGVRDYVEHLSPLLRAATRESRPAACFMAYRHPSRLTTDEHRSAGHWSRLAKEWKKSDVVLAKD